MAACGCINDLSMMGAKPIAITSCLVLEEGLELKTLSKIVESMDQVLSQLKIPLIAADTKLVERGS